jgi:uncharacterized ferritin-like protein (DUF455 family)
MDSVYTRLQQALQSPEVGEKCATVVTLWADFQANRLDLTPSGAILDARTVAGWPARPLLVPPRAVPMRDPNTPEGQVALIHAIAHIEFSAINLALDAAYRFRAFPEAERRAYLADWIRIADEERDHFSRVAQRLQELGVDYGDLPAHAGLWDAAIETEDDFLDRMTLVPRVLEARGLDVTPGIRKKFAKIGDVAMLEALDVIYREEVGHVAAGTQWFQWGCAQQGLDAEYEFEQRAARLAQGRLRGPFNHDARKNAGFTAREMEFVQTHNV